ncbi:MAG: DUF58 domain-containing protein [Cyanobacteria bacterium]|nr:DUF58 domain-containing protein [Cyanobacteriota bacterium]
MEMRPHYFKYDEPRSVYLEAEPDLPSTGLLARIKNSEVQAGSLNPLVGFKKELANLGANSSIDVYKLLGGGLPSDIKAAVDKLTAGQRPKIHEKELRLRPGNSDQQFMGSLKIDSGSEPIDHRFYVYGDSIKNIDWKRTARQGDGTPVVKQFGAPQARIKDYVLDLANFNFGNIYRDDRDQFILQQINKLAAVLETLSANIRNKQHQNLYISYQGQMLAAYNEEDLKKHVLSFKNIDDALGKRRVIEDFMQDLLYLANYYSFSRYQQASPLITSGFHLRKAADHKLILITDNQNSLEMTMPKISDLAGKGFSFAYGFLA